MVCYLKQKAPFPPARTYMQLPLQQWGAGNVYLLVLPSWEVKIAENPIAVMGLYIRSGPISFELHEMRSELINKQSFELPFELLLF